jgi:hypothetical protein
MTAPFCAPLSLNQSLSLSAVDQPRQSVQRRVPRDQARTTQIARQGVQILDRRPHSNARHVHRSTMHGNMLADVMHTAAGDGFVADFGLDENVHLVDSHTDQPKYDSLGRGLGRLVVTDTTLSLSLYLYVVGTSAAERTSAAPAWGCRDRACRRRSTCGGSRCRSRRPSPPSDHTWSSTSPAPLPPTPRKATLPPNLRISLSLSLFAITTCVCVCVCAGEAWVVDRDALVFRLAVDTHSIPLVCAHAYDQSHQGRVGLARH